MRIVIEANLFGADHFDDEHHAKLLALFHLGNHRVHSIEVERRSDSPFEIWLRQRDASTQRICRAVINESLKIMARRRMREIRIAKLDVSSWETMRLRLDDACRMLQNPLVVVLEDAMNDRNFLEKITSIVPNGKWLHELIQSRQIQIGGFGGVESNTRWLKDSRRLPDELARVWMLSDSDAKRPWRERHTEMREHLSSAVHDLAEECKSRQVPLHILTRRSIENYLPVPALRAWSTQNQSQRQALVDAFSKLRPEQRHHYRMKKGFEQNRHEPFYHDVPEEVMRDLDSGFGKEIAKLFAGLPIFIHEHWLINDQQKEEAKQIVDSIVEHL